MLLNYKRECLKNLKEMEKAFQGVMKKKNLPLKDKVEGIKLVTEMLLEHYIYDTKRLIKDLEEYL
jgi:hypothetical protein